MPDSDDQQLDQSTYSRVGLVICGGGVIALLLSLLIVKHQNPFLEVLWPVMVLAGLLMVAATAASPTIKMVAGVLAFFSLTSLINGHSRSLRYFVAFILLGAGAALLISFLLNGAKNRTG